MIGSLSRWLPRIVDAPALSRAMSTTTALGRFKPNRGTGDTGQSSLFNDERRWKDDAAFQAVGTTDELSSYLGVCRDASIRACLPPDVPELLTRLQCCLQDVSAHLATPADAANRKKKLTSFDSAMVEWLDGEIERYGDAVPPLRQFILSGGGETSASLQYARTIARRAERATIPLIRTEDIDPKALVFLNRLSDLLFVLGRYACMKTGHEELVYMRPKEFTQQRWQSRKLKEKEDPENK
ncbi:unnamed protein product, partial [Mesorhabditis spiculigera]